EPDRDVVIVLDQAGMAHADLVNETRQVRHPAEHDLRASWILLHRCHSPLMRKSASCGWRRAGPWRSGRAYSRVYGAATAKGHEHVRVARRQDPLLALSDWRSCGRRVGARSGQSNRRSAIRPRHSGTARADPQRSARGGGSPHWTPAIWSYPADAGPYLSRPWQDRLALPADRRG